MLAAECCSCDHGNHKDDYAASNKKGLEAHKGEEDSICHGAPDSRPSVGEVEVVASDQGIFVDSFSDSASHPQEEKVDDDRRQYVEKSDNDFKESVGMPSTSRKWKGEQRGRSGIAGEYSWSERNLTRRTESRRVWDLLEMRDETRRRTRQDHPI